jgi:hypothetical protein
MPPNTGPNNKPQKTPNKVIPSALPLSFAGKTEAIIAKRFPKIIALPRPCKILKIINISPEIEKTEINEAMVNITIP